ncbi:MAG: glycine zipper domain-containing protein [Desulfobacteraceae bacterium]|jgi:surface antigen
MRRRFSKECVFVTAALFAFTAFAGCSGMGKAEQGAVIGGLGGAAVGSQLGPDDDRGKSALIGAGIGAILGYMIGNEWEKYDQRQLNRTLETAPSGRSEAWVNPDTGNRYAATPQPAYRQDGRVYRDVEIEGVVDGRREVVHAKAYRRADGTWQLVQ